MGLFCNLVFLSDFLGDVFECCLFSYGLCFDVDGTSGSNGMGLVVLLFERVLCVCVVLLVLWGVLFLSVFLSLEDFGGVLVIIF